MLTSPTDGIRHRSLVFHRPMVKLLLYVNIACSVPCLPCRGLVISTPFRSLSHRMRASERARVGGGLVCEAWFCGMRESMRKNSAPAFSQLFFLSFQIQTDFAFTLTRLRRRPLVLFRVCSEKVTKPKRESN